MKPIDNQLNRLFKAAAQAPKAASEPPSFALETRVMGAWKSSWRGESGDVFVAWFRRAAVGACVLAMASLAWNFHNFTNGDRGIGEELAIADSSMQTGLNP